MFDPIRAAFLLVAFVVGIEALIAVIGFGACIWYARDIVEGKFKCDVDNRLSSILSEAAAMAMALAMAFMNRKP